MLTARAWSLATPVLLLSFIACDQSQLVEPTLPVAFRVTEAPSGTNAVAVSHTRIDVSWADNSTNETAFEVHRSITGLSGEYSLRASTSAGATSYSDLGLNPSTEHCYKVRAVRTTGRKTTYSEFSAACATTLAPPVPAAPSGADAKPAGSTVVEVRWVDQSTDETGFRVERSLDLGATWAPAVTTGLNATSAFDYGRTSEQQGCHRVIAFNAAGDSPPSNTDCTTPPAAPTALTATAADGPAIDLAWTDNSAVEDGYEVLRATDGLTFSTVANLPANSAHHRDVGVNSTISYAYRVQAKKDNGFSDLSNTATVAGSCGDAVQEQCDNGLDDDCNGLIDTDDPACQCFAWACPQGFVCDGWSGLCFPEVPQHCGDGVQSGDESDVDCGGSCATLCTAGQHCYGGWDCASGICVNDICQP